MRRQTVDPRIRAKVIATYGNRCWLGMPGCSITATEDDHIIPFSHGGKDTVANLRRACKHCNAMRQDRVLSGYGATMHAVIGPPRADFGMAMQSMLRRDSIVVSFDSLLRDLCPTQSKATDGLRLAAAMAWDGAARTLPRSRRHPDMLAEWLALDYDVHVIETPADSTFALDLTPQEYRTAQQWYALHLTQQAVDARLAARRQRLAALGLRRDSPTDRPRW